jgi:hypothetical protein
MRTRFPIKGATLLIALWALLIGAGCSSASAQISNEEYARMGQRAVATFECSLLAKGVDERNRLFKLGYDQGKTFFDAWADGKIDRTEPLKGNFGSALVIGLGIGIAQSLNLGADFALGFTYATLFEAVGGAVERKAGGSESASEATRQAAREQLFQDKNCHLL